MKTYLNTFRNFKNPNIYSKTSVIDWIEQIKNPNIFKSIILEARTYLKTDKEYDKLKSELPTICWNATFNSKRDISDIIDITGYIFIDIDDCSYDINKLNKNKVYAIWNSFGNCGYSLLVKCSSITIENFKNTYITIINELGLNDYYDKKCNDITRQNVLSYDENIYFNENCEIFNYDENELLNIEENTPIIPLLDVKKYKDNVAGEYSIIYSNISEVIKYIDFGDKTYYCNWNGINVINCECIPNLAKNGNRNNCLLTYCNNFVILNNNLTFGYVLNHMKKVNKIMCETPLLEKEIINIVNSIFNYKKNGTLKPVYSKRKILFSDINQSKEDKLETVYKLLSEKRSNDSKQRINDIIEQWDFSTYGKITKEKIVKNNTISKNTVDKYWYIFKDVVKDNNNYYLESLKEYKF